LLKDLDGNHIRIVTPSRWLADHVSKSPITDHLPVEVIPYGIDVKRWRPLCKSELKSKLGLDPRKTALLYIAENFQNRRKGFLELMIVFKGLKNQDAYQLVSVGKGTDIPQCIGKHLSLGVVRDEERMIEIYNACDLFIVPSFEDNFPNVILESMACGTPVIAFGSGGIVEMIDHQSNGLLVETGDLSGMRDAIKFMAENSQLRRQMGEAARNRVCNRNSLELHGSRLLRLYEELLADYQKVQ
jgi:glycosyltransferase involved in cell wall biosynthesis